MSEIVIAHRREMVWRSSFVAVLALCTGFVGLLLLTNAWFLGGSDALFYLQQARLWRVVGLTLGTASLATIVSMAVAVPLGYVLSRWPHRGGRLLDTIVDIPLLVPPAALGMFLLGFFGSAPGNLLEVWFGLKVIHTLLGVVVAQVLVSVSFAIRIVKSTFDIIPRSYEDVAGSLGASRPYTFMHVCLPMAKTGILAGTIVAFVRAVAEYEALMLFVGAIQGRTDVMSLAVYLDVTAGRLEWAIAISAVSVVIGALSVWWVKRSTGQSTIW